MASKPKEVGEFVSTATVRGTRMESTPNSIYESLQETADEDRKRIASIDDVSTGAFLTEETRGDTINVLDSYGGVYQVAAIPSRILNAEEQPYFLASLRPQRTHLRTKRLKRCRECQTVLVKPENKSGTVKFTIKMTGIKYIPMLTIANPAFAYGSSSTQLFLRVQNPYDEDLTIRLSTATPGVAFSASEISIRGFNEFGEYPQTRPGEQLPRGLAGRKDNWVVVEVHGEWLDSDQRE
ncbi:Dynactin subunit 4, partial [Gonapodya sp. JEL0774]